MPRNHRVVLVLHDDPTMQMVVADAASDQALVTPVPDWTALSAAIRETPPSTVSIVDPYFGAGSTAPAPELRELLQRLPSASIVAALSVTVDRARDVTLLDDWGVAGIISIGHDDTPSAVQLRLRETCALPVKRFLVSILPPTTAPDAYALVLSAAETTCAGGTVADLAAALGASPSTLLRRTEEAGLPTPRTLIHWMRVLLAAMLLDEPERGIDEIARASGYASPADLRRALQRHLQATPGELRTKRATELATHRFLAALQLSPP